MLIACPACATRYAVPDSAIGVEGRSVRCAKCRHNWFQEGPALGAPQDKVVAEPAPPPHPAPEEPIEDVGAADALSADSAPLPDEPGEVGAELDHRPGALTRDHDEAYDHSPIIRESGREPSEASVYDDDVSQFAHEPPFRPRHNRLKLWTIAAAIFALLAAGAIAAVAYWGVPEWAPIDSPTFAAEQPDLVLEFPPEQQDRRTLPNGTEFFGASGSVTNIGRETRALPPILIVLRDARDRIVYSWEVAPPQTTIAPGETVSINEAVTDVPRSAQIAEIGWKPS